MATVLADMFDREDENRTSEHGVARGVASWLIGAALVVVALALALALWSFDPNDPSFNVATERAPSNILGSFGSHVADLSMQLFGRASWFFVVVFGAWGLRAMFGRPLNWPMAPIIALPIAVLAICAYLAAQDIPQLGWHLRVGLGGMVGKFQYDRLIVDLGRGLYEWGAFFIALVSGVVAIGVRWTESLWAMALFGGGAVALSKQAGEVAQRGANSIARNRRARARVRVEQPDEEAALGPDEFVRGAAKARDRRRRSGVLEDLETEFVNFAEEDGPIVFDDDESYAKEPPVVEPPVQREEPAAASTRAANARRRAASQLTKPVSRDRGFQLPALGLLGAPKRATKKASKGDLDEKSRELETVLDDFGVRGEIVDARPGPVVTLFELEPAPGTRAARVISLADDVARSISAKSVRIATMPGRNVIGVETPNDQREMVYLRELLTTPEFSESEARLALALGKNIAGEPIVVDLARMPHLLIAGTTGSGKSVAINAMILSLLYRLTPSQCRLLMIDPKMIELSIYKDIPHLLTPVVTEPAKAVTALKWLVREMDERYRLMSHLNVRDVYSFNRKIEQAAERGEQVSRRVRTGFEPGTGAPIYEDQPIEMKALPLIVVIVDEVADLMLTAGKEIETTIQRLSQKARAAGIHLIVATQRPSVDVVTGVIKANLPSRISFKVSSKIDSRTVLGETGAEQLLGSGDMLYMMPGDRMTRIHGPFVTDAEVEAVAKHLCAQGSPDYVEEVLADAEDGGSGGGLDDFGDENDPQYVQAMQIVIADGKASTSYLQRKMSIGYNTAAKLIERMESDGVISAADHVGRRQVLAGRGGVDGVETTDV